MARKKPASKDNGLEASLGYKFRDPTLLAQALTHSSARSEMGVRHDNERLEFLGDRVLGLVVAELLTETMPEAREGDMAKRFNVLVRRETCAEVAREIGLGPLLVLSGGEAVSGGRAKDSILADACEAVLGAIFLDGGFVKARRIVRRLWESKLVKHDPEVQTDAKTALQEWAQGLGHSLPQYVELQRSGPAHAPVFTSEVRVTGLASAKGIGPSKRAAEQAAAQALLEQQGIRSAANGR